jgi:hypothetical protein
MLLSGGLSRDLSHRERPSGPGCFCALQTRVAVRGRHIRKRPHAHAPAEPAHALAPIGGVVAMPAPRTRATDHPKGLRAAHHSRDSSLLMVAAKVRRLVAADDLREEKEPFAGPPAHFDPRSAKIRAQLAHLHLFRVTQSLYQPG